MPEQTIATGFIRKLYRILDLESDEIIRWDRSGRSFSIHDSHKLDEIVLKKYYRGRIKAFRRQLQGHGFESVECEEDEQRECYQHEHFQRGNPDKLPLIVEMKQVKTTNTPSKKPLVATKPTIIKNPAPFPSTASHQDMSAHSTAVNQPTRKRNRVASPIQAQALVKAQKVNPLFTAEHQLPEPTNLADTSPAMELSDKLLEQLQRFLLSSSKAETAFSPLESSQQADKALVSSSSSENMETEEKSSQESSYVSQLNATDVQILEQLMGFASSSRIITTTTAASSDFQPIRASKSPLFNESKTIMDSDSTLLVPSTLMASSVSNILSGMAQCTTSEDLAKLLLDEKEKLTTNPMFVSSTSAWTTPPGDNDLDSEENKWKLLLTSSRDLLLSNSPSGLVFSSMDLMLTPSIINSEPVPAAGSTGLSSSLLHQEEKEKESEPTMNKKRKRQKKCVETKKKRKTRR